MVFNLNLVIDKPDIDFFFDTVLFYCALHSCSDILKEKPSTLSALYDYSLIESDVNLFNQENIKHNLSFFDIFYKHQMGYLKIQHNDFKLEIFANLNLNDDDSVIEMTICK